MKTTKPQPLVRKAKKAVTTARKGARAPAPRVRTAVLAGGYRVFGTPVEPKHTTREQIAEAVAAHR